MATKGWSFGALTDALRSAAFIDASTVPKVGEVPIIDADSNLVIPYATGNNASAGLTVKGANDSSYDVRLVQVNQSDGTVPSNWFPALLQFNAGTDSCAFGIVRDTGPNSLGYGIANNGVMIHQYMKATGRHKLAGNIYTGELNLGPQDTSTTGQGTVQTSISATSNNSFIIRHQDHAWTFNSAGGIEVGPLIGGEAIGAIRVKPAGGTWEDGSIKPCGLQIDLSGTSASTIFKATVWGSSHVTWMNAAYSGNIPTARWYCGNTSKFLAFTDRGNEDGVLLLSQGGFTCGNGSIVASTYVRAGGGSSILHPDANLEGPIWGGYLSKWLNNQIAGINSEVNNRIHEMRFTNTRRFTNSGGNTFLGAVVSGVGDFGGNDGYGDISDLQYYKNSTGWVTVGFQ